MTLSVSNSNAILALLNPNNSPSQPVGSDAPAAASQPAGAASGASSAWSITQGPAADVGALGSVAASLDRASSISDVAAAAGQSIANLLQQMKQKAEAAQDPSADPAAQQADNTDFKALLGQIGGVVDSASFDGANLLNGSLPGGVKFMAGADGGGTVTLSVQDMSLGGPIVTIGATSSIGTPDAAASSLSQIDASLNNVAAALAKLDAQASQISAHSGLVNQLSDVLQAGGGDLTGANMGKDGARLQALQVQQQLGGQASAIANQTPQVILSLFR
jgi:flagellin